MAELSCVLLANPGFLSDKLAVDPTETFMTKGRRHNLFLSLLIVCTLLLALNNF